MPQPLPANPYPAGSRSSDAYIACLSMEGYAFGITSPARGPSTLLCARLLGYMLLHAPTQIGHNNIANEVSDCRNFVELGQVACKYIDDFLRCCECVVMVFYIVVLIGLHALASQSGLLRVLLPRQAITLPGHRLTTSKTHLGTSRRRRRRTTVLRKSW